MRRQSWEHIAEHGLEVLDSFERLVVLETLTALSILASQNIGNYGNGKDEDLVARVASLEVRIQLRRLKRMVLFVE